MKDLIAPSIPAPAAARLLPHADLIALALTSLLVGPDARKTLDRSQSPSPSTLAAELLVRIVKLTCESMSAADRAWLLVFLRDQKAGLTNNSQLRQSAIKDGFFSPAATLATLDVDNA